MVVYVMFSAFLLFFILFILVLYPARDLLHPHATADYLTKVLPAGCKGFIAMYRYWTFTAFYVMAELWSNVVLFMLFWGFANQITRLNEATRFYGLFGIGANLSGVAAGLAAGALYRDHLDARLPFGTSGWEQTMTMLLGLVVFAGFATMAIFYWINSRLLPDPRYYDPQEMPNEKGAKVKLSLGESFSCLLRSKYLLSLAFIVIAYNLVINLVEILWKHEMRELYPHPGDYNLYLNSVTTWTGLLATLFAWFVTGNSIRKFGWTFTAMLTPAILLVTSVGFFSCFLAEESMNAMMPALFGTTPLAMAVFFGSTQNIFCRAAKYSVFDSTKEMAFVPLSTESKMQGKAAIDGMAVAIGKSSGSIIHQSLLLTLASFVASAPYTAILLLTVIVLWMLAVRVMGVQFTELTQSASNQIVVKN